MPSSDARSPAWGNPVRVQGSEPSRGWDTGQAVRTAEEAQIRRWLPACAACVRDDQVKPDAGNLHVRFEEGGGGRLACPPLLYFSWFFHRLNRLVRLNAGVASSPKIHTKLPIGPGRRWLRFMNLIRCIDSYRWYKVAKRPVTGLREVGGFVLRVFADAQIAWVGGWFVRFTNSRSRVAIVRRNVTILLANRHRHRRIGSDDLGILLSVA